MPHEKPKIIAIVGPTASGKTALAIELARRFNGEIISADSRQVYRGMDIGTAKPTYEELAAIPHHLIDIKNPDEEYTAAEYKQDAASAIRKILERRKIPFLVGGTGLYIKALIENLDIPPVKADPELRRKIEREIETDGLDAAFKKLVALDPDAESVVDPKNPRRVVRALEVALLTGKPFTAQRKSGTPEFSTLMIGLNPGAEILREQIDTRIDEMFRAGLAQETESLIARYSTSLPAFDSIGYRETISYLKNVITLEEAIAQIKINTWRYAKRQMTWFRKQKNVHWVDRREKADQLIKSFLDK